MGFGAIMKGLLVFIISCYIWVRSYPFILVLVIFFYLLYRFLPSVFSFLVAFSPIIACTGVLLQVLFSFGHPNVQKDQKKKDDNASAEAPSWSRRRRNVNGKTESSGYRSRQNHAETSVDGLCQHLESGASNPALASLDDSCAFSESSTMSNDGSYEMEDESGSVECGVKPVEWTEDDAKNLMDLGSSELERNRRLENLIAKRMARKLSKMAVERDLIDFNNHEFPQIPAVTTKRSDPLLACPDNPDDGGESSAIPCSAPSVLLPRRNPFDLPYDPLEEKPNLMEDSFQEEFMSVQQKDVHFCRHESFFLGPSFIGEPKQDMPGIKSTPFFLTENIASQSVTDGGYPSLREGTSDSVVSSTPEPEKLPSSVADLGDQKLFIEQESQASDEGSISKDIGLEENRDIRMDKEITHDTGETNVKPEAAMKYEGLSSSPSLGEEKEAEVTDNNHQGEPDYDSSPSAIDKKTIDDNLFCVDKGVILTTASSIDSDLQVELSQAGSPSAPLDRTFSLTDGDSFFNPNDDGNELRSNKVTKSRDLESERARLSGDNDDQVAPHVLSKTMVVEHVSPDSLLNSVAVEQVSIDTSSSSFPPIDQVSSPISDPNVLLDEKEKADQVTGNSSDGSPLEGLIHPFKGEVSSGNQVPYGASSHHSDNENESRSNKITQSSELETAKDELSRSSEEPAAPNVVLESMVVEQVSYHSVPESVAVEKVSTDTSSSYSPRMDQVPLPISDPKIPEKADPVSCNSSEDLSHEGLTPLMTGKPEPLVEEPIAQPPPEGVHEEPQMQFLIEKPSLNDEEPQEQSTIPENSTEETIIASRNEPVVCQDQTDGKQKSKPNEINEGDSALASSLLIAGGESVVTTIIQS